MYRIFITCVLAIQVQSKPFGALLFARNGPLYSNPQPVFPTGIIGTMRLHESIVNPFSQHLHAAFRNAFPALTTQQVFRPFETQPPPTGSPFQPFGIGAPAPFPTYGNPPPPQILFEPSNIAPPTNEPVNFYGQPNYQPATNPPPSNPFNPTSLVPSDKGHKVYGPPEYQPSWNSNYEPQTYSNYPPPSNVFNPTNESDNGHNVYGPPSAYQPSSNSIFPPRGPQIPSIIGTAPPSYATQPQLYETQPPVYGTPAPSLATKSPVYETQPPVYGTPAPVYGTPALSFATKSTVYETQPPVYGTPASVYGTPGPGYGAPTTTASFISNTFIPTDGPLNPPNAYGPPTYPPIYGLPPRLQPYPTNVVPLVPNTNIYLPPTPPGPTATVYQQTGTTPSLDSTTVATPSTSDSETVANELSSQTASTRLTPTIGMSALTTTTESSATSVSTSTPPSIELSLPSSTTESSVATTTTESPTLPAAESTDNSDDTNGTSDTAETLPAETDDETTTTIDETNETGENEIEV
ncbi:uncharacterized protein LOC129577240 isoform X2 [Sitodiplosis mosellana]|uniref:uncharacterized protein LOC129577240 isoform X2 n=1 Tax=Sitodiplosis mosellana TaxID=263140 RepID=UPI0024438F92|nr:uncharacterized protein LOC129577240 isoform X2 [Sitodiplosis mosellana]